MADPKARPAFLPQWGPTHRKSSFDFRDKGARDKGTAGKFRDGPLILSGVHSTPDKMRGPSRNFPAVPLSLADVAELRKGSSKCVTSFPFCRVEMHHFIGIRFGASSALYAQNPKG